MNLFLTKKTAAVAVLLIAAGSAYAATCTQCFCVNVGTMKLCFCQTCQQSGQDPN